MRSSATSRTKTNTTPLCGGSKMATLLTLVARANTAKIETLLAQLDELKAENVKLKEENRELRAELFDARERILDLEGN